MERKVEIQVWGLDTGDISLSDILIATFIFRKSGNFQVYCQERLTVETVNREKPQCRSLYVIKHVKKRRKLSLKTCTQCGR